MPQPADFLLRDYALEAKEQRPAARIGVGTVSSEKRRAYSDCVFGDT